MLKFVWKTDFCYAFFHFLSFIFSFYKMIYFSVNKLYVFEKLIFLALKRCIAFPITLNSF